MLNLSHERMPGIACPKHIVGKIILRPLKDFFNRQNCEKIVAGIAQGDLFVESEPIKFVHGQGQWDRK
jgi:hypothetical protein